MRSDKGCCGHSVVEAVGELEEHKSCCDKSYVMGPVNERGFVEGSDGHVYKSRGTQGENNMGKLMMQLAHFMTQDRGLVLN